MRSIVLFVPPIEDGWVAALRFAAVLSAAGVIVHLEVAEPEPEQEDGSARLAHLP